MRAEVWDQLSVVAGRKLAEKAGNQPPLATLSANPNLRHYVILDLLLSLFESLYSDYHRHIWSTGNDNWDMDKVLT